ncbi:hypothetical protein Goari_026075 [Gossypium aridum]|uniref:Uncharacterized protein n=1 Tax=Gossypium aridum TaxID=34290 RepID=A0A7J8XB42_GOSAI|nr:hypothetical protein [Gossypium aridum]
MLRNCRRSYAILEQEVNFRL